MDIKLAEKLVELVNEAGYDAELREDYSGRFMYGKTTAGIVMDSLGTLLTVVLTAAMEYPEAFDGLDAEVPYNGFRTDSMGMDMIIY